MTRGELSPADSRPALFIHWGWWVVAALVLLSLWGLALRSGVLYALAARQATIGEGLDRLAEQLHSVHERRMRLLAPLLPEFFGGNLTAERFEQERSQADPMFQIEWLGGTAPSKLSADLTERILATSWAGGGRWGRPAIVALPSGDATNSFFVVRNVTGQALVVSQDERHFRGVWLPAQVAALGFGDAVSVDFLPARPGGVRLRPPLPPGPPPELRPGRPPGVRPGHPAGPPPGMPPGRHRLWAAEPNPPAGSWQYRVWLEPDSGADLLLTVRHAPLLAVTYKQYGLVLAAAALLFGGLGFALNLSLASMRKELALARAKANFTALVSHELRTPIAAIRMHAEALRDGLVTEREQRHKSLGVLVTEALRLQRIVENILALGKVERGVKAYSLKPCALEGIVREAVDRAVRAFPDEVSEVPVEVAADLPLALVDREAASQAVTNLVHNALKYGGSPDGIAVRAIAAGGMPVVEVLDRGPGVPQAMRESIFTPYVRVGDEATRTSQGLGLGLALVKSYMDGQGGTILLRDRPGGGSVFALEFQPAPAAASPAAAV